MSRTALVLRHDAAIHLGNIGPVLQEHGYAVRYIDVAHDDLSDIDPNDADLLVVLGGEMGAYEVQEYPFLSAELDLLRARFDARRPVLGVCLGAQLMANALGARVYRGESTEIGFRSVEPTTAGAGSPLRHIGGVPVLQWHGDTFDLPAGVTRLAGSPQYANEAFAIDEWALAVQFHPEVTDEMHELWLLAELARGAAGSAADAAPVDAAAMRQDSARHGENMQRASRALFSEWLDGLDSRKTA